MASGLPVGPERHGFHGGDIRQTLVQGQPSCHSDRAFSGASARCRDGASSVQVPAGIICLGAPVEGMLFAMEVIILEYDASLAALFACMVATFTTDTLITSFGG